MSFKVVEIFESINGEGMRAGELAVFVRMKGTISHAIIVIRCGQISLIVNLRR